MKKDAQIYYQRDYDFDRDIDNSEEEDSSILVTNKESLKVLNDQISEILNKSDNETIHQIKYPESQDPDEVPFHYIKFQDNPDDEDEEDEDESLGIGCWMMILVVSTVGISIFGLAIIGLKQLLLKN